MSQISLYQLLLIFALGTFVYLVYLRGNRKNKKIISYISKELEEAINPVDKIYRNLGGTAGYKAFYERNGNINKVVALFTTLPRQSVFIYPFHLIFGDHDRVQVNAYCEECLLKPYFILIKDKPKYRRLIKKYSNLGLKTEKFKHNKNDYFLYYKDDYSKDVCNSFIKDVNPKGLISFSAYPETGAIHLSFIPERGRVVNFVKKLLKEGKSWVEKDG